MQIKKRSSINNNNTGWYFILIPTVLISLFSFYPMIKSFIMSLQTGMGNQLTFTGFDNYIRLFSDPVFKEAVFNTLIYLIVQVPIMTIMALTIAVLLNDKHIKFKGLFRTAIFLPCVTSLVAYSVLFKSLFAQDGLINSMLMSLHIIGDPIMWMTDPFWAKIAIIIAITWRWTGYNMIFYLAALQNVDSSIYEAADIDGASKLKQFFKLTVPMIKPIILFTTIMSTIGTLQIFDEVVSLTNGGPANATLSISQYIYNLCFKYTPNFGYAAAVSYAVVIMVAVLSFIQFKLAGDKDE